MYDILVIGENCIDNFIEGNIDRLSPEAPIPILVPNNSYSTKGMAENVLNNITGLAPEFKTKFLTHTKRIKKTRYIDKVSGYILLRVDEDDFVDEKIDLDFTFKLIQNSKTLKAIIISDYNKGFLSEKDIESLTLLANELKILVFLDTKKILGNWSSKVDFVKINLKEYGYNHENKLDITKHFKNLVVTKGPEGSMCLCSKELKIIESETPIVSVRDVTGAGDTYLAAFTVGILTIKYTSREDLIQKAMDFANYVASIAVSRKGTTIITKDDIKDYFN